MDLHTPVCDLLCCDYPVVLAGMGGVARSELVAAVAEAGGFGFLGMVRESPQLIAAEIAAVRDRTARPFGVNLIPAATKPALLDAEVRACVEGGVHAVTLFWDLSAETVKRLRGAGVLVACQVGSLEEAIAAQEAGADILIAQGWEAGGHVRGRSGLHALVASVLGAADVPVLAAGGVTDGEDLAAVMRLGAQGAVLGTAFLATRESFAHDYHKRRIVEAAPGETVHTEDFHINWPPNAAVRVLPNSVTRGARGDPHARPRQVVGADGDRSIYLFSTDSPLRSMTGDFEAMALYAGQGAGRIGEIVPAGDRLRAIVAGAMSCLPSERRLHAPVEPGDREAASAVCYAGQADAAYM
ncbi:MAG: nitronate monooxygenase, partial [Phenylobacterium sp.]|nr:nitronate monooxygenase [Phenylobacterium sp.]